MDDDTVLAGDAGDAACDTLERTEGDADNVVRHKAAFSEVHLHDVLVLQGCYADKRFHFSGVDGKGRVLAIHICYEMVVVVCRVLGFLAVLDIFFGFLRCGVDKKKIHKREQLALFLARLFVADILPDLGQIHVSTVFDDGIRHGLRLAVLDTEDKPKFVCGWGISHRHPCL